MIRVETLLIAQITALRIWSTFMLNVFSKLFDLLFQSVGLTNLFALLFAPSPQRRSLLRRTLCRQVLQEELRCQGATAYRLGSHTGFIPLIDSLRRGLFRLEVPVRKDGLLLGGELFLALCQGGLSQLFLLCGASRLGLPL